MAHLKNIVQTFTKYHQLEGNMSSRFSNKYSESVNKVYQGCLGGIFWNET